MPSTINMSNKDILIRLYKELSKLEQEEIKSTKASEETIHPAISMNTSYFSTLLQNIFRDRVHVVHPPCPSNQFLGIEESWHYYINKITELKVLSRAEPKMPIIAIWNNQTTNNLQVENKGNEYSGWNMIVILPEYYNTCLGLGISNQSEFIFLRFSTIDEHFQKTVKAMLSKKHTNELNYFSLSFGPLFIIDNPTVMQDYSDKGWWTVYSACMIIMTGSATLNNFTAKPNSALEARVRDIFQQLGLLEEECNPDKIIQYPSFKFNQTKFPIKGECNILTFDSNVVKILKRNQKFIDKSIFIKEILDNKTENRIIMPRPRRWGKGLNLSMLYEFLHAEIDDNGNIKERNSNYDLFANGKYTDSR